MDSPDPNLDDGGNSSESEVDFGTSGFVTAVELAFSAIDDDDDDDDDDLSDEEEEEDEEVEDEVEEEEEHEEEERIEIDAGQVEDDNNGGTDVLGSEFNGNGENDNDCCAICMNPYSSQGDHQVSCLRPCGHVYGFSCIQRWIKHSNQRYSKCPVCNRKCSLKDVIKLYASRLSLVDKTKQQEMVEILDSLDKKNNELKENVFRLLDEEMKRIKDSIHTLIKRMIGEKEKRIEELTMSLEMQNMMIGERDKRIEELTMSLERQNMMIRENDKGIEENAKGIEEIRMSLERQNMIIGEKDKRIEELTMSLERQNMMIQENDKGIEDLTMSLERRNMMIRENAKGIEENAKGIEELTMSLKRQNMMIREKDKRIEELTMSLERQNIRTDPEPRHPLSECNAGIECQLCMSHSHQAVDCPFMNTKCEMPNCDGFRMILRSNTSENPGRVFFKCQNRTCKYFEWMDDVCKDRSGGCGSSSTSQ